MTLSRTRVCDKQHDVTSEREDAGDELFVDSPIVQSQKACLSRACASRCIHQEKVVAISIAQERRTGSSSKAKRLALARARMELELEEETRSEYVDEAIRRAARERQHRIHAVTQLQQTFRRHVVYQRIAPIYRANMLHRAACRIQNRVRSMLALAVYSGRKFYAKLENIFKADCRMQFAVVRLQSIMRGYRERRAMRHLAWLVQELLVAVVGEITQNIARKFLVARAIRCALGPHKQPNNVGFLQDYPLTLDHQQHSDHPLEKLDSYKQYRAINRRLLVPARKMTAEQRVYNERVRDVRSRTGSSMAQSLSKRPAQSRPTISLRSNESYCLQPKISSRKVGLPLHQYVFTAHAIPVEVDNDGVVIFDQAASGASSNQAAHIDLRPDQRQLVSIRWSPCAQFTPPASRLSATV